MSRTAVIVSDAEDSTALCRLCMIYHEHFVNIFIPNNTFRICAEEAIHDLLSLKVAVRDGLPSNICHQCVKKLMDFRDFKEMCLKTAAELRKCDLDNFLKVSKVKDEDAANMETSRKGSSQENTFVNDIRVMEVYVTIPDELAMGNESPAKELWSCDNALVVKEEVYDGEHCIESDVPVNAYTSVAVDPLAVEMMALKEEAQEQDGIAGGGYSLGDTSPHNHIQLTEVFVPVPDKLAMGILSHSEEDSRSTELMVKEEIGEGLDCSEIDVQVVSLSSVNVDPLAVDTAEDCCNYIGGIPKVPEIHLDTLVSGRQEHSQHHLRSNSLNEHMREGNLQVEYSGANSHVAHCYSGKIVKRKGNIKPSAPIYIFSLSNDLNQLKCDRCGKKFRYYGNLKRHLRIHTGVKPFKCNMCGKCFTEKGLLKTHLIVHTGIKPYICAICGKTFPRSVSLARHSVLHTGENAFKCNVCGKNFTKKSVLNIHLGIHTGVKPFKCNVCGKNFAQKGALKSHLVTHTGTKPFKCNVCGNNFSRKGGLKKHLMIHTGIKPFKCNECGKTFTEKSVLNIHLGIHTGVKPFKCNLCGKNFAQKGALKSHLVTHTGIKPFKCNVCGNNFSLKSGLKKHLVIHTGIKPFKCNECGKNFSEKGSLKNHLLIHSGVKPYKCDVCGKMFNRSGHLKRHYTLHTGVKPFACDVCGKEFTEKHRLKTHLVIHTHTV